MPYFQPEPMNIVYKEENSGIPSNDNEAVGQSKVDTEPTSSFNPSTIQVTFTSQMDNESLPNDCHVSMNKPHTNLPPKVVKVQDFLKDLQLLQTQIQDFKQLINDMKRIKDQIYSMVVHMDYHIDILLDIKEESKTLPKLECINCGKEFCTCIPKRDGSHLGEVAFAPSKKKKVTATNV